MNRLLKNILWMFVLIVFSNVLLGITEVEPNYLIEPIRFLGISLILSLIGGYVWFQVEKRSNKKS